MFSCKVEKSLGQASYTLNRLYLFDQESLLSTFRSVSHWIQTDALTNKDISLELQASVSYGYNFNKSLGAG